MCFSIPLRVVKIKGLNAVIEGGDIARFDKALNIKKGDYVHITGDIIVDKLPKGQGIKIRKLIKKLNS